MKPSEWIFHQNQIKPSEGTRSRTSPWAAICSAQSEGEAHHEGLLHLDENPSVDPRPKFGIVTESM